jgi:flavin-dependent dehydrogenase
MSMMHDVAVVGGGPAGCSAAISLAASGARVILLEAGTYPHDKVCGEFLSPECGGILDALGVTAPLRARGPARIETVRITAPNGATRQVALPGSALGISRSALDETMAQRARHAGAEVREGSAVTRVAGDLHDGFRLELRAASGASGLRARVVIAAHGRRGALDRTLRRHFLSRLHPFVALKNHFHGPPLLHGVELHAFPSGYCGISPIEGGAANVCLLAHESVFRGKNVTTFLEWMRSQNSRLRDWLSRAEPVRERWLSIAQVPFVRKGAVAGDILMAGDAAGVIVPMAGDGIAMALQAGRLAASLATEFLAGHMPADELRRRYSAEWRREFGARLTLARGLQAIMLRPRLLTSGLRLLAAFPPLGAYLVAHTRGGTRTEGPDGRRMPISSDS